MGIVHFVGGALVGTAPRQTYGSFLEDVSRAAGGTLCIVATPCTGLTGLDHWAAASEVLLRWCAAQPRVLDALAARVDAPASAVAQLPVFGLGHSLGAKLLLLLGADESMASTLEQGGGARRANVLVAYNNFSARRSVPMLEQAAQLGSAAQASGLTSAAAAGAGTAVASLSGMGERLGAGASIGLRQLGDVLGRGSGVSDGVNAVGGPSAADQLARSLGQTARVLDDLGRSVGEAGRRTSQAAYSLDDELPDEFEPGPAETDRLVLDQYGVGRNLLVRFTEDTIDQSGGLARLLQRRFIDETTGLGGRLELKTLDGSHVTPNAPDLAPYLDGPGLGVVDQMGIGDAARDAVDAARRAMSEREAASELVATFVVDEARRAADQR